jgi:hypothetical protein
MVVSGETVITPQFIQNPFPALAGQWTGAAPGIWTNKSTSSMGMYPDNEVPYTQGFVNLNVTNTGAFTIRVVVGRNAFSATGTMDASGKAVIKIPPGFSSYLSKRGTGEFVPDYCTLSLENGIRFAFGDPSGRLFDYGNESNNSGDAFTGGMSGGNFDSSVSSLSKAGSPEMIAALRASRFNAVTASNMTGRSSFGFVGFNVTGTGLVLASGVANIPGRTNSANGNPSPAYYPHRTVKYSLSTPLVVVVEQPQYMSTVPQLQSRPGANFYAVTSSSEVCLSGRVWVEIEATPRRMGGTLRTRSVSTGPLDPAYAGSSRYDTSQRVVGRPWSVPKAGRVPIPFSVGKTEFVLNVGMRGTDGWGDSQFDTGYTKNLGTMGRWFLLGSRSVFSFRPETQADDPAFSFEGAALQFLSSTGAFSGTLRTKSSEGSKTRTFSGLVVPGVRLQTDSQEIRADDISYGDPYDWANDPWLREQPTGGAIGMSTDGLLITFE